MTSTRACADVWTMLTLGRDLPALLLSNYTDHKSINSNNRQSPLRIGALCDVCPRVRVNRLHSRHMPFPADTGTYQLCRLLSNVFDFLSGSFLFFLHTCSIRTWPTLLGYRAIAVILKHAAYFWCIQFNDLLRLECVCEFAWEFTFINACKNMTREHLHLRVLYILV